MARCSGVSEKSIGREYSRGRCAGRPPLPCSCSFSRSSCPAAAAMTPSDPTKVVESWSQAINASDDDTAAGLFAPAAVVIQDGRHTTLKGEPEALAFNSSLPCGGKIVKTSIEGNEVTATFTLTRRPVTCATAPRPPSRCSASRRQDHALAQLPPVAGNASGDRRESGSEGEIALWARAAAGRRRLAGSGSARSAVVPAAAPPPRCRAACGTTGRAAAGRCAARRRERRAAATAAG